MNKIIIFFLSVELKWILTSLVIILIPFCVFLWRRRYLYYYGSKIPGPFGFPLVGSLHLVKEGPHGIHKFLHQLFNDYPSVFRIWLGPNLYVSTTEAHHLKTILTQHLDKGNFYHLMSEYFQRALAASPVSLWRKNRKNVNPTFNISLIHSFVEIFSRHGKILVKNFEEKCGKETDDIFPEIWTSTLDAGCETLADVDPNLINSKSYLDGIFRIEEILLLRFFNPLLHLDILWNLSPQKRELVKLFKENCSCIQKMLDVMKPRQNYDSLEDSSTRKRFLQHLVDLNKNNEVPHDYILEEAQIMFFVGTETSAVAMCSFLVILGMYPEIQKKIHDELDSIFAKTERDPTLEDVNKMEYLERVIKETLRLLPPIPFVMRTLGQHLTLDSYTFPAGAHVIVPIEIIHRKAEYWPDPLKFNPDRFLPEETEKRPPCAYIPFSYGVRNCIGYKYGLLSMKVMLAMFLRSYRVKSSNYKSVEEMELYIHVVAKTKKGYKIEIEKRN